jgi:hypothetical protein
VLRYASFDQNAAEMLLQVILREEAGAHVVGHVRENHWLLIAVVLLEILVRDVRAVLNIAL